jgi:site-specific recombinase XerD
LRKVRLSVLLSGFMPAVRVRIVGLTVALGLGLAAATAAAKAAPSTMARRLACLSHFHRRIVYEGLLERNPFEFADRSKVPEQAATAGLGKQRARRLITVATKPPRPPSHP